MATQMDLFGKPAQRTIGAKEWMEIEKARAKDEKECAAQQKKARPGGGGPREAALEGGEAALEGGEAALEG